mmetsp:Transcript_32936/g.50366  ORF Transcript_32936/g.50366 Transcript_32936/m.50366 type:complete len:124 (+) Transcript_32936:642-1013(+)
MCSDIQVLNGKIEDCSGQCMHGGVCMNGECDCRKGFEGKFCQIVEAIPDKTNYALYLRYFLLFIVMILCIILLLIGSYLIYKKIKEYIDSRPSPPPQVAQQRPPVQDFDEDAMMGSGIRDGPS